MPGQPATAPVTWRMHVASLCIRPTSHVAPGHVTLMVAMPATQMESRDLGGGQAGWAGGGGRGWGGKDGGLRPGGGRSGEGMLGGEEWGLGCAGAHAPPCTPPHTHVHTHTCTHTYTFTHLHTHTHARMHTHTRTHTHAPRRPRRALHNGHHLRPCGRQLGGANLEGVGGGLTDQLRPSPTPTAVATKAQTHFTLHCHTLKTRAL